MPEKIAPVTAPKGFVQIERNGGDGGRGLQCFQSEDKTTCLHQTDSGKWQKYGTECEIGEPSDWDVISSTPSSAVPSAPKASFVSKQVVEGSPGSSYVSNASFTSGYPPNGTAGWGELDLKIGKDKIRELWPMIEEAAIKNGISAKTLAAIILQEGRGMTAAQLRSAAGVAQIGVTEINALKNGQAPQNIGIKIAPHPELEGNYLSDHNQIFGAAAYLAHLQTLAGGNSDLAVRYYNGGYAAGGNLNDPEYMSKHAQALQLLESFGIS